MFDFSHKRIVVAKEHLSDCSFLYYSSEGHLNEKIFDPSFEQFPIVPIVNLPKLCLIFIEVDILDHRVAHQFVKGKEIRCLGVAEVLGVVVGVFVDLLEVVTVLPFGERRVESVESCGYWVVFYGVGDGVERYGTVEKLE